MRAAFLFATVALTSVALADGDLFAPSANEAVAEEAARVAEEDRYSPPNDATTRVITTPADADGVDVKATDTRTTITITADSVSVSYDKGEPQPPHRPGSRAIVVCDSFTMESAPGERPKLHCQECEVILPNGSTGHASDVTFDSATKKLTLTGGDEQPVKLISNDQGGIQEIVSAKMDIQLKFAPPQPSFPQPAPAAYIDAGDPFAPATLKPSPIHRTDKALIAPRDPAAPGKPRIVFP